MIAIHNGRVFGEKAPDRKRHARQMIHRKRLRHAFFVEEYGIVLALALLMLYLWIFFRGIEYSAAAGTAFPGLLVLGLALLITCQALLHNHGDRQPDPRSRTTLPLISRGGRPSSPPSRWA